MRSAFVYNFLIEANIMASIAILLMIPLRTFSGNNWETARSALDGSWLQFGCYAL